MKRFAKKKKEEKRSGIILLAIAFLLKSWSNSSYSAASADPTRYTYTYIGSFHYVFEISIRVLHSTLRNKTSSGKVNGNWRGEELKKKMWVRCSLECLMKCPKDKKTAPLHSFLLVASGFADFLFLFHFLKNCLL